METKTTSAKIGCPLLISCTLIVILFLLFGGAEEYFEQSVSGLIDNQKSFAFTSFLVLCSDIVLPVPSSIVMYLNGAVLGMFQGAVLSFVSVMVSSVIGYLIGLLSLKLFKNNKAHSKSDELLKKTGPLAIILTRGIPILSESVTIVAGYNSYSFYQFLLWNFIGYLPVCLIYAYFGSISNSQDAFLISFGISIAISFVLWIVGKKVLTSKPKNVE
jgi:uncharacterized membrane protein YdjX (TVP38/TMEM64 family)